MSVVITNYNTWPLTLACVNAITQQDMGNHVDQIVIVDDCSEQQPPAALQHHPRVEIRHNVPNMGYVASVNKGFSVTRNELVLLLDSDAKPLTPIDNIIRWFENNQVLAMLGFRLIDKQGRVMGSWEAAPGVKSLLLGQQLEAKYNRFLPGKQEEKVIYSCAVAVRKEAFEAVQGFDESFDFLDADVDFAMRINGTEYWKVHVDESITMLHEGGGSPQLTARRVVRYYKNRMRLLRKHGLLRFPVLTKMMITTRLAAEYAYLKVIGFATLTSEARQDKLASRAEILRNIRRW